MKKIKRKSSYYIAYSAAMTGIFMIILFIFWKNGKSFVRDGDGLRQHYITLEYWGKYLRQIIKELLIHHRLRIPTWDLHIGFGSDIVTTLHYYVIGDPLNLCAAFVPVRYTEYLYDFLCFFRYYLAGITFSWYCFYNKNEKIPVLLGSLIYVYSQWMIVTGLDHPYFINPCIYLPLIMLGADKIFDGKKPWTYIGALTLAGVSNFYFFYMLGIFTVIYAVFRYFTKFKGFRLKEFTPVFGRFFAYTVLSLMISGVILFPMLKTMFTNSRMTAERYMPILYSKRFYQMLLASLIGRNNKTRFSYIGVASICVIALIVLFMQRKKYLSLKLGVILLTVMVCFPIFGRIMNGFSYTTNRWTWAVPMLLAYIFVKMFPEFFHLSVKKKLLIVAIILIYAAFLIFNPTVNQNNNVAAGLLLLLLGLTFIGGYEFLTRNRWYLAAFSMCFIVLSVGSNIWFYYAENGRDRFKDQSVISTYVNKGRAYPKCHTNVEKALKSLEDSSLVRFDQKYMGMISNTSCLNDLNGGKYQFSIAPEDLGNFFDEIYMSNFMDQAVYNLNGRSWLLKLFSVKYFVSKEGIVPYHFSKEKEITGRKDRYIYKDENSLPLVYTYDSYIPVTQYERMNPVERQEAMLQGCVLEENDAKGMNPEKLKLHVNKLDYEIKDMQNMTWENGVIEAGKNAKCVLTFKGKKNCETYVAFSNLKYRGINEKYRTILEQKDITTGQIEIYYAHNGETEEQKLQLLSSKNNFGSGRSNYGANLLYNEDALNEITLEFTVPGKYKIDNIDIYTQAMDGITELSQERSKDSPKDLKVDGGNITCSINLKEDKEVVFSIPYSNGWTLYVDGKKQETNKANRMFLGARISKGQHQIELKYFSPGMKAGCTASVLGLLVVLILFSSPYIRQHCRSVWK